MTQLDALRAFAAFGVMLGHFYGIQWSLLGVHLFFVLSGFLITGILLKCRDSSYTWEKGKYQLRQFYIRRSLRIFPLYYLVILVLIFVNFNILRNSSLWYLTYTSNIYFALIGRFGSSAGHFWSLAVEEQFYLLWPCLILFLPEKYLLRCISTACLLGLLYRIGGSLLGLNFLARVAVTIGCLDFLGIGALLAFYRYKNPLQFNALGYSRMYQTPPDLVVKFQPLDIIDVTLRMILRLRVVYPREIKG